MQKEQKGGASGVVERAVAVQLKLYEHRKLIHSMLVTIISATVTCDRRAEWFSFTSTSGDIRMRLSSESPTLSRTISPDKRERIAWRALIRVDLVRGMYPYPRSLRNLIRAFRMLDSSPRSR